MNYAHISCFFNQALPFQLYSTLHLEWWNCVTITKMVTTDIPMTSAHILLIQCSEQFHNPGYCFYFLANVREDQRFISQPTYKYPVIGSPGIQVQVLLTTSQLCPFSYHILPPCPLLVLDRCVLNYTELTSNLKEFQGNLLLLKLKIGMWVKSGLDPQNTEKFLTCDGRIEVSPQGYNFLCYFKRNSSSPTFRCPACQLLIWERHVCSFPFLPMRRLTLV